MAYQRLDITDGKTTLVAAQVSHIEDGIIQNESDIASNAEKISQNADDISKNANNITQNTTDIKQNTDDIATNKTNIEKNTDDISANYKELVSSISGCYKTFGRSTFTGSSVDMAGDQRQSVSISYPSSMTNHDFYMPVSATSGNGYITATVNGISSSSCTVLLQDIRGASTNTLTPTVMYFYADK